MAESAPLEPEWFKEFKKVTAPSPPSPVPVLPTATPPNGSSLPLPATTERRKHLRFEVDDAAARFHRKGITTLIGFSKLGMEGSIIDLSEGGLRLLTDERVVPGTRVHVQIKIARFQDLIESDAETRWCRQDPKKEDEFHVGLKFTGLDASQAKKFAIMREYFTSTQYKALRDARVREQRTAFRFPK